MYMLGVGILFEIRHCARNFKALFQAKQLYWIGHLALHVFSRTQSIRRRFLQERQDTTVSVVVDLFLAAFLCESVKLDDFNCMQIYLGS